MALSGCAGGSAGGSGDPATLYVFGPSTLDQLLPRQTPEMQAEVQAEIFEAFIEEHPEIEAIEWDAQGTQADGVQRLLTSRLAGEPIDLIACAANPLNGTLAKSDVVLPLDEHIEPFKDRIEETALGDFTVDGTLYGVPISTMSTSTFYYNADIFAEYGIPENPTYEDLAAAATELEADGIAPVLHQGSNTPLWPMWYFEALGQTTEDPVAKTEANIAGDAKFTDPEDVEAFQLVADWVEDGILSRDSLAVDEAGMRAAFLNGESAMYYGGTWELAPIENGEPGFEWGVFPFPQMPGTEYGPTHGGGADNGICISNDISEEKLPHAVDFIEFLTRPEIAAMYLEPEEPVAASITEVPGIDTPVAEQLRETTFPDTAKFLDWMWPSEVTNSVANALQGVVGGELTPEEAAADVQRVYDNLEEEE